MSAKSPSSPLTPRTPLASPTRAAPQKMASPGWGSPNRGCRLLLRNSAKGPISRILFRACSHYSSGGAGSQLFSVLGARSDAYRVYASDDRQRTENNWPRPEGLRRKSVHTLLSPSTVDSPQPSDSALSGPIFTRNAIRSNSVNRPLSGHSSRRRVAADTHQRPTRRFRQLHEAPQRRRPVAVDPARAALPHRADAQRKPGSWFALPSLFGLAPCGVYPAPAFTGRAVRSYRTISPLPRRGLAVQANLSSLSGKPCPSRKTGGVAEAVSFLWHWPSVNLEAHIPDVIRHTALRSSDFPPPATRACAKASGSDRPVLLPVVSVPRNL